jgi:hypothetical protein
MASDALHRTVGESSFRRIVRAAREKKKCDSIGTLYFQGSWESWKLPIISDQSEVCKPIFICKHVLAVDNMLSQEKMDHEL